LAVENRSRGAGLPVGERSAALGRRMLTAR
jgi:hypothetical protein